MKKVVKYPVETENFKFFQHKECEYFPCHDNIEEEEFNCLFCYCPLYCLGEDCGGSFNILENGTKDCTDCIVPHLKDNFDYISDRYGEIKKLFAKK